ncbi:MAG: substrate-binding domain-containing protein [Spirochaetales bacterium]|nr:substrate-binding domain-containing protein [Spirochaetales bacterium]
MKRILVIAMAVVMAMGFAGCSSKESAGEEGMKALDVAVIIKATSSDFWQYVLVGAENYGAVHGEAVNITTYGPSTEAEIAEQVTILENVIITNPDVIVIASTSSEATVDAINSAREKGIVVITIDNKVKTDVDSFLATDNLKGGAIAADRLIVSMMEKQGVSSPSDLTGKVGIVTAMSGVQVLIDRNKGFIDRMNEAAPQLEFVTTIDINNDMAKGVSDFSALMDANPDLAGVFGDNNTTGNAVAKVLQEKNLKQVAAVAYDSDEAEVMAVKEGWLQGIVVQDPYRMGYDGVSYGLQKLAGLDIQSYVDTGAVLVTADNINDTAIKGLLDPRTRSLTGK